MRRLRPATLRARVVLAAVGAVAAGLLVLVLVFNDVLASNLRGDLDSRLRSRAAAALSTVEVRQGRVSASEGPGDAALDEGVWLYQGHTAVERARAPAALQRAVTGFAAGDRAFATAAGGRYRLHSRTIVSGGRPIGTVVVAGSLAAYDRATDVALAGSLVLALLLLVVMATVTWFAVGSALRPVEVMGDSAAAWGDHDLDRRFGTADRPRELQHLAATFDALLDRVAASLRHEQRLSAELSHELRTPLAQMSAQAELLRRRAMSPDEQREAAELTLRSVGAMTSILDTLMTAARAEATGAPGRCDALAAARAVADRASIAHPGVSVVVGGTTPVRGGADAEVLERALSPLVENAARFARHTVRIDVSRDAARVRCDVRDDGPGIAGDRLETVFEPGVTSAGGEGDDHEGAGLGLALARRLARAAGGDVEALPADGGAHLRLSLPSA